VLRLPCVLNGSHLHSIEVVCGVSCEVQVTGKATCELLLPETSGAKVSSSSWTLFAPKQLLRCIQMVGL
jgi:hypothetical protein